MFLASLDQIIVSTSIPAITKEYNSLGDISWLGTAYMMTSTAFQPLYGNNLTPSLGPNEVNPRTFLLTPAFTSFSFLPRQGVGYFWEKVDHDLCQRHVLARFCHFWLGKFNDHAHRWPWRCWRWSRRFNGHGFHYFERYAGYAREGQVSTGNKSTVGNNMRPVKLTTTLPL